MTSELEIYKINRYLILHKIHAHKLIHRFRTLIYQVDRKIRKEWFDCSKEFLLNESHNPSLDVLEKLLLKSLQEHWDHKSFEQNSPQWWLDCYQKGFFTSKSFIETISHWLENNEPIDYAVEESNSVEVGDVESKSVAHSVGASTAGLM